MTAVEHRVRVRTVPGWVVAHCRCGWAVTVSSWQAADHAAITHLFDVAPDGVPTLGLDEGGSCWQLEEEGTP